MTNSSRYLVNVRLLVRHYAKSFSSREVLRCIVFLHLLILFFCLSPCLQHLLTFSLQDGDVQSVEEAQSRLSFLAQSKKLWSQQMFLDVGAEAIHLRDVQSQVRTDACKLWLSFFDAHIPMQNDLLVSSTHAGWVGELLFQIHLPLRCN